MQIEPTPPPCPSPQKLNFFQVAGKALCAWAERQENALWFNERSPTQEPRIMSLSRNISYIINGLIGIAAATQCIPTPPDYKQLILPIGVAGCALGLLAGYPFRDALGITARSFIASPLLSACEVVGKLALNFGNWRERKAMRKMTPLASTPTP